MKQIVTTILLLFSTLVYSQNLKQRFSGIVLDQFSNKPLDSVAITIMGEYTFQTMTNSEGRFRTEVNVGRYTFYATKAGYATYVARDIQVTSGKEKILEVYMGENVIRKIDEIKVQSSKPKHKALQEMSLVSARQFVSSEASLYAGSLGDPARMAQNFAGVQGNNDRRNDIIIRGNSPLGLSWRAEGIEIPNPNHFAGIGLTGGAVSILNNNNLSNCDFLTGAFPAIYGNALAGVFDLRLKNGNIHKTERTTQFGLNGLEMGFEGPISKKNKSSYIVNGRYSTLGLIQKLGLNLGATAQAEYRDLTFKLNFPSKKHGTLQLWGIGGYNITSSYSKNYDTTGKKLNPRPKGFDTYFDNWMGTAGVNHQYNFNDRLSGRAVLAYSTAGNLTKVDSLYNNETEKFDWLNRYYHDNRITFAYQFNQKWNTRHLSTYGLHTSYAFINAKDSLWWAPANKYLKLITYQGNTHLTRAYVQHLYKPMEQLQVTMGLHGQYFQFNRKYAVEPRFAVRYAPNQKLSLSAGFGIHNQTQPFSTYFYNRSGLGNFIDTLTNRYLDFTQSAHYITGLDYLINKNFRIKLEAYHQDIQGAAVESTPSSYSTLNEGAFYFLIPRPFNVNKGKGRNTGVEFTAEKFFGDGYYFLATGSLYDSKYAGSDGIWRNTAFNGNYTGTVLAGYEFKVKKNDAININLRMVRLGGKYYTPVDTLASSLTGNTTLIDSLAFSLRYPDYNRIDVKIGYRMNRKRVTHEYGLNIDNITNYQNIQSIEYDRVRKMVGYSYQVGIFPIVQYRLEW